jgi:YD repeat-containing protein
MDSALGGVQTFRVEDLADGSGRERIATQWVGSPGIPVSSIFFRGQDGSRSTLFPDGTAIDLATTRDPTPSLGSQAPYVSASTVSTPGGVTSSATRLRAVTTTAGVLATRTDSINENGRVSTERFTAATGEFLTTTPAGRLLARRIDPAGRTTRFEVNGLLPVDFGYDAAGRLASITQGSGAAQRVTSFSYDADGYLASATDPMLRSVSFAYDGAGRITTQTLPDLRQVGFSYDLNGNLTSLTPPGQPAHVFRYTPIDQEGEYQPPPVAGVSDPRTFFDYDLDQRLDLVTRPDGTVLDFQYDTAGRLAALVRPAGTTVSSYADGTPPVPGSGNLLSIAAPGGETLVFGYDGSLLTSTSWSGPVAGSVSQSYDAFFRPASQSVNGGFAASFGYDGDGLLVQAGAESLARDALTGLLTGTSLASVSTGVGYSSFGERSADMAALGGSPFYTNSYLRDKLGRLAQKTETIQGATTVVGYGYDPAGRLEQVATDGILSASYAYDANGNRLSATTAGGTTSGSYDAQDRLLAYGTRSYAYTGNGDLASKTDTATGQTTSYGYDTLGNLVSVLLPDGRFLGYLIDGHTLLARPLPGRSGRPAPRREAGYKASLTAPKRTDRTLRVGGACYRPAGFVPRSRPSTLRSSSISGQ